MKTTLLIGVLALLIGCNTPSNNQQKAEENATQTPALDNPQVTGSNTTVRYLDALPAEYNENDLFDFILSYGGFDMIVSAWPMPDNEWLITSHWCEEEDGGLYYTKDEQGNEVEVEYKDPFNGQPYPVLRNPDFSFTTRNYGGETINFYKTPDGQEVACSTNYKEISLDVAGVDLKTRRILAKSNPKDWCWGEPADELDAEYRHPFVELEGWIDEEWVCSNTVTTCP